MKSIFITGAASGIGRATALLFARRGYRIGAYDLDVDGARKVAELGGSGMSYGRLDVTNAESWTHAIADFDPGGQGLNVLFNCAGILHMGRFEEVSADDCRKQLDVNVMGVILGIQACLPLLERSSREADPSVIVNMSSASAVYGQPELAAYSASKFAVRALTEALDLEFRTKNLRVCDVMPGYVDTPMVRTQEHPARSLGNLGVKLTAEDVAEEVWKAVHGRSVHYIPELKVAALSRLGGLLPELGRAMMQRIAK